MLFVFRHQIREARQGFIVVEAPPDHSPMNSIVTIPTPGIIVTDTQSESEAHQSDDENSIPPIRHVSSASTLVTASTATIVPCPIDAYLLPGRIIIEPFDEEEPVSYGVSSWRPLDFDWDRMAQD